MSPVGARQWPNKMRTTTPLVVLAAIALGTPAWAQSPALGQFEIKALQPIPKAKTAVQLGSDTALGRNLRREVMTRLARRGNEVGFSGGNVMRMEVTYFDFQGGGGNSGSGAGPGALGGDRGLDGPAANSRPEVPGFRFERREGSSTPSTAPTLRLSLTLYAVDTGKVIWVATGSCSTTASQAERAGEAIIESIFESADKSRIGDAGCPL